MLEDDRAARKTPYWFGAEMGHADVVDIGEREAHAGIRRVFHHRLVLAAQVARRLGDAIDEICVNVAHAGPALLPQKWAQCTQSFANVREAAGWSESFYAAAVSNYESSLKLAQMFAQSSGSSSNSSGLGGLAGLLGG